MDDRGQPKICGVCGDKAIAKNFGAFSCESCKAFFRRNASKINVYKCYFDENCKLDPVTRKFCRKCRLRKCFEIGMKQEWILNEEEKQVRRMKIEEKRKKRKHSESDGSKSSDSAESPSIENSNTDTNTSLEIFDNNITDDDIITNIMEIENFLLSDEMTSNEVSNDILDTDEIAEDVYQKAVELEFAVIPIARPLPENSTTFNDLECSRLTELFSAFSLMPKPSAESKLLLNSLDQMCTVMAIKMENDVKNYVSVSKNLSSFNSICENDQISLLKYGSLELIFMRSVLTYNYETDYLTLVLDENNSIHLKLDLFKGQEEEVDDGFYSVYKNYLRKIGNEWDSDPYILDLLTAIALFNPERPNIMHKDMVKLQQQTYMYLLQRYLQIKFRSECESKSKFLKLLNILHDLNNLQEVHKKKRSKCTKDKSAMFGPLLTEIFDA